ncbi:VWA domain-containing protein [Bacillus sp. C15]|uniref:VWA domain-containing protein n=1 Tax=Bacillus sp. C15 TaxID=867642 RepID=UPI003982E32B
MDKLQEVKKFDITIFTSWLKKYAECGEGLEKAWHFLIEQAELSVKQQEIIEENKRQQEVTVIQFRQAQEDIKLLQAENKRYRNVLEFYADDTTYTNEFEDCPPAVELDGGQTARKALEGDAE